MQQYRDETVFDWIQDGRRPFVNRESHEWKGNFVYNLLPQAFDAYVKVLHRIDARYENIDTTLSPSEIAILKIPPCEELKSFIVRHREQSLSSRVRWKGLADLLRVPFAPEINLTWYRKQLEDGWCWPQFLSGPCDATLGDGCLTELINILSEITGTRSSFFRFSRWQFTNEETPRLFAGTLGELTAFLQSGQYRFGPEYWWPTDRTWCVCSDYDLKFTIVGGPKEITKPLMSNLILECIEVTPQTRIDDFAPMP